MAAARTWGLRIVAMVGVACLAGGLLWYYFLYRTSPTEPTGDHVLSMREHGQTFYVRDWELTLVWALPAVGLAVVLLVAWLDGRDKRKHGRLYRHTEIPDWRGRPKSHPRDIFTYEFGFYIVGWIVLCALAIASGGRVPFGML